MCPRTFMRKTFVCLIGSSLLLTGCGAITGRSATADPPPQTAPRQASADMIGQIDDDRDPEQSENILAIVLLFPAKTIGALTEIPVQQLLLAHAATPAKAP